jgi:hypothetical protein
MASKGVAQDKIARMSVVVRRNKRMGKDTQRGGVGILWAADDPNEYFFEQRPRKGEPEDTPVIRHTIASYFREAYGITLRYPSKFTLTLIRLGFPCSLYFYLQS